MPETEEERKKRLEEERSFDRKKIEAFEKQQAASKPVIDESRSTHQEKINLVDSKEEVKSRFAKAKAKFAETGERISESWKKRKVGTKLKEGAKLSAEDLKDDLSYEVRKKLNRLSEEEAKEELKKVRDRLSTARTQEKLERAKQKVRQARKADNESVFTPEGSFFGINMSGLNPEQFYGFGMSGGNASKDVGFDIEAYNRVFNSGYAGNGNKSKSIDLMNFGSSGGIKAPSMDDVKAFYNMGGSGKGSKTKGMSESDIRKFYGM